MFIPSSFKCTSLHYHTDFRRLTTSSADELSLYTRKYPEYIHCIYNNSSRILEFNRPRCLGNSDEPDTRRRPRKLTNTTANSIATYIDHYSFEEKGDPWEDIAYVAGVITHRQDEENKENTLNERTVQRRVQHSGIKSYRTARKDDLEQYIRMQRSQ
jgi:hypothetical protein